MSAGAAPTPLVGRERVFEVALDLVPFMTGLAVGWESKLGDLSELSGPSPSVWASSEESSIAI